MARQPKPDTSRDTTPERFPEVAPPYGAAVSGMHLVESMMQIQQSIGELKSEVRHLKEASDGQSKKLDRISHVIFAAGVVIAILLAIGSFFLNKMWEGIFALLTAAN